MIRPLDEKEVDRPLSRDSVLEFSTSNGQPREYPDEQERNIAAPGQHRPWTRYVQAFVNHG
jgi:hypothetical protein